MANALQNQSYETGPVPNAPASRTSITAPKKSFRTLIVDDDQFDRIRIQRLLSLLDMQFEIEEVGSISAFEEIVDTMAFDLAFVDYNLTHSDGLEVVKRLKEHPQNSNAATIMIAGEERPDVAEKAMQMGCKDYILKSEISSFALKSSILGAVCSP